MSNNKEPDGIEFEDPLENYEPKEYSDPVERALMEEPVSAIHSSPVATITSESTVFDALEMLSTLEIACVLVTDGEHLVGIFSERDVLDRVADDYESIKTRPIGEFMTANPIYVREWDPPAKALSVMALSGYRHVPVLDDDDNLVGIVSPLRVTGFLREHFQ